MSQVTQELATSSHLKKQTTFALTLGAIGVVYGDIGTSPLYTVKEIFLHSTGLALNSANILGAISSIFWALMVIVTLKYVLFVLRADNNGEGGGLALTSLVTKAVENKKALKSYLLMLGLFGATLFYGDSVITPAISVLGAVEGLEVIAPSLKPLIVPIALGIIVSLFLVQKLGTRIIGKFFGPIVLIWFLVLGFSGVLKILNHPEILLALNPIYAYSFLTNTGASLLLAVGAIVLALTGAEALYADMGHFGRKPIQLAWMLIVFPCLALQYLGQGALLMQNPAAVSNPFFYMFSKDWLSFAVVLATLAAIIASQAVISGAYSMTKQAILLGYLPRMQIKFTSANESGQIYVPFVNWMLLIGVIIAILLFQNSSALAGAYGIAVTLTMAITTVLTYFVMKEIWKIPAVFSVGITIILLILDLFLFASCMIKFFDGGWFSIVLALSIFLLMTTWSNGRQLLIQSNSNDSLDLQSFIDSVELLDSHSMHSVNRTAIYPVSNPHSVPQALLHNMKHNQVLHTTNIILNVQFKNVPWVLERDRLVVKNISKHFWQVTINYGFMETPNVPLALQQAAKQELIIDEFQSSYFLSRETVVATKGGGMAIWREKLFATMMRNSGGVVEFFQLPDNSVVELGTRVQI